MRVEIDGLCVDRRVGYADRARKAGSRAIEEPGRYKTKLSITAPKKAIYSFRHTLIDDLRDAGVQNSRIKRMLGTKEGAVTISIYGSHSPLKPMAKALGHIMIT